MKLLRKMAGYGMVVLGILGVGFCVTACKTGPRHVFKDTSSLGITAGNNQIGVGDKLRIGDQVMINFSGSSGVDPILHDHTEAIKEDGNITPPLLGSVSAAGKTPGELQQCLQTNYNALYRNLTVTVVPQSRFYYVSGEVKKPGPEPYLGETDIIKAISAAGDFTDFANKKKVKITRANGQSEIIDVQKIFDEPTSFDVPIYPGDKIYIRRRIF